MNRLIFFLSVLGIFTLSGLARAGLISAGTSLLEAGRWRGSFSAVSGQGNGDTSMGVGVAFFLIESEDR